MSEAIKKDELRYRDGKLTRHGMEQVIKEGGVVALQAGVNKDGSQLANLIVAEIDKLPSEAELAAGDDASEAAAAENIQRRRDALDREEARLHTRKPAASGAGRPK